MRPLHAVVMGAIGLTLVAAGCGGAIPSSNGGSAMLKTTQTSAGRFLVDGQGHSLYLFDKDEDGESYCTGACAAVAAVRDRLDAACGDGCRGRRARDGRARRR